jgi:hypothetical protein
MKKGTIGYYQTSVNYQHISCNIPEERRLKLQHGGSLKSRTKLDCSGKEISHVLFPQSTAESFSVETVSFNAKFMGPFLTLGPPHDFTLKGEGKRKTVREGKLCRSVL